MPLHVGPSTAFFVSTPVISGAIMETAARECDAAADRAGSWSAAEEKVDARKSMMCKRIRPDMFAELLDSPLVSRKKIEGGEIEAARFATASPQVRIPRRPHSRCCAAASRAGLRIHRLYAGLCPCFYPLFPLTQARS